MTGCYVNFQRFDESHVNIKSNDFLARHSGLPPAVLKRRSRPEASDAVALATVTSWEQLPRAFSMLRYLGPDLACDTILMGKLLRLGRAFMAKVSFILDFTSLLYLIVSHAPH